MVNRGLVIALAKEPFREWLLSLPDPCDVTLEKLNEDATAYLIPEYEDDKEREKVLKKLFDLIFADQLADWWTNEEDWPQKRDLRTFRKWFDLRFHSVVEDLVNEVKWDTIPIKETVCSRQRGYCRSANPISMPQPSHGSRSASRKKKIQGHHIYFLTCVTHKCSLCLCHESLAS